MNIHKIIARSLAVILPIGFSYGIIWAAGWQVFLLILCSMLFGLVIARIIIYILDNF